MKSDNVKIICDDKLLRETLMRNLQYLKEKDLLAIFERSCPSCFNHVSNVELEAKKSCSYHKEIGGLYGIIKDINKKVDEFSKFFERLIGYPPSSVQRIWAMRILSGQNTAIIAPTGMGKTTFGLTMALYLALQNKISYIILPTKTLLEQVLSKLKQWEKKLGINVVIAYTGKTSKDREKFFNALRTGNYKVIITTLQFFARYINDITEILRQTFCREKAIDFMFVDDVDSFLRNPRNLTKALLVLGYRDIWGISEVLEKLREMASLMRTGQYEQLPELTPTEWEAILEARKHGGILVVSSATGRIRGQLPKLILSYILGMSVGGEKEGKRNVLDLYDDEILKTEKISINDLVEHTVKIVKRLGTGGLIFIAMGPDSDIIATKLEEALNKAGIKAENIEARKEKAIKDFAEGKIDILIGKAYRYGLLVRGLDLPERVRYTVFVKIPRFSARLTVKLNPIYLSFIMKKIARALGSIGKKVVEKTRQLVSATMWLSPEELKNIENEANEYINKIAQSYFAYYLAQMSSLVKKEIKALPLSQIPLSSSILDVAYKVAKEELSKKRDKKTQVFLLTLELGKFLAEFLESDPITALKKAEIPFEVRETEDGQREIYILTSDVKTYIQASGRASRLYAGGITYGISIIIPANTPLLNEFEKKLKWITESPLKPLSHVNLDEELKKVDEDRKRVRAAREGKISPKEMLKTCLFIVESPRKAKTIASFFGKPVIRILPSGMAYETVIGNYLVTVIATLGHITDLVTHKFVPIFGYEKQGNRLIRKIIGWKLEMLDWPYGIAIVDINGQRKFVPIFGPRVTCPVCLNTYIPHISLRRKEDEKILISYLSEKPTKITNIHDFFELLNNNPFPLKCPVCGNMFNPRDRLNMIETLRLLASEVDVVAIGTDPDIEGEKIAWDIYVLLKPFARKIIRVEFHEVTRRAIEEALRNPREIDMKMVRAQITRRIEDRWIGFLLSEEIREILQERNLSAGRVQTPVLGWVIDNYTKWQKKKTAYIIRIPTPMKPIEFTVVPKELKTAKEPIIKSVEILKEEFYKKELTPPPPLTTDRMLTLASLILDLDVRQTMLLAQKLFESGLITYIRTDSTRVSDVGIAVGKKLVYDYFGAILHVPRDWSRSPEEGAHECIRPTRPLMLEDLKEAIEYEEIVLPEKLPPEAFELYDLITRIFAASQMKKAHVKMVKLQIKVIFEDPESKKTYEEVVELEGIHDIVDEGFIKAYDEKMREVMLPKLITLPPKKKFSGLEIEVEKTEIREERLLTDGDLVRLMREKQIGRPSTYAIIIDKLFKRKYIKHHLGKYIRPTRRGQIVFKILNTLHKDMVSEERTADLLRRIDEIEKAKTEEEAKTKFLEILNNLHKEMEQLRKILISKRYLEILPREEREKILSEISDYRERVIRYLLR